MSSPLLRVENLSMRFGGLLAVDGVSLHVGTGEILSVIGPNGAGKTTVFNCISGFYRPSSGEVWFNGEPIHRLPGHQIARRGLVRTFQHVRLFGRMTLLENLLVAQHRHLNTGLLSGLVKTPDYRRREKEAMERAIYWLEKVDLIDHANREAENLSYGQQRRLEIARCMATRPRLLMLDEPAAGLNPRETEDLKELIVSLKEECAISVLLIEHDMSLVMDLSDRIYVLNQGRPLAEGTPDQVRHHPEVIKAYLGEA